MRARGRNVRTPAEELNIPEWYIGKNYVVLKTRNQDAWKYVINRTPFEGSNLSGWLIGKNYVVFSYRIPIYVYSDREGKWYGNNQKYFRATAVHERQADPRNGDIKDIDIEYVSEDELWRII